MYFFTSDEHYDHGNIIKYCSRPFYTTGEMNHAIISKHNDIVGKDDVTVHGGDFTLHSNTELVYEKFVSKLNGSHIFLKGSHDWWLPKGNHIWEKTIEGVVIIVCHYAMRTWPKSHYGSWQLYGHSHGNLEAVGKQMDIGVDTNDFYPYSFEDIKNAMKEEGY